MNMTNKIRPRRERVAERVYARVLRHLESTGAMSVLDASVQEAGPVLAACLPDDVCYVDRGCLVLESVGDDPTSALRQLYMHIRQLEYVAARHGFDMVPEVRPMVRRLTERECTLRGAEFAAIATFRDRSGLAREAKVGQSNQLALMQMLAEVRKAKTFALNKSFAASRKALDRAWVLAGQANLDNANSIVQELKGGIAAVSRGNASQAASQLTACITLLERAVAPVQGG